MNERNVKVKISVEWTMRKKGQKKRKKGGTI